MKRVVIGVLVIAIVLALGACNHGQRFDDGIHEISIEKSSIKWSGYEIDGGHSGFVAFKSGQLEIKDQEVIGGVFIVELGTIKTEVEDNEEEDADELSEHLKNEDFFDVSNYPMARLVFTSVEKKDNNYQIKGDLTIKDITQEITFKASLEETFRASFSVDRTKFGIDYGLDGILNEFSLNVELHFLNA